MKCVICNLPTGDGGYCLDTDIHGGIACNDCCTTPTAECECIMCCPNGHCECAECDEPCPEDCLIDQGIVAPVGGWFDEDSSPWRGER